MNASLQNSDAKPIKLSSQDTSLSNLEANLNSTTNVNAIKTPQEGLPQNLATEQGKNLTLLNLPNGSQSSQDIQFSQQGNLIAMVNTSLILCRRV